MNKLPVALKVTLGIVLAIEAGLILYHAVSAHHDLHLALVGAVQGLGALLFIWPRTMRAGACVLICLFLISAVVHLVRGEFPSEHLVYAIAVAFMTQRSH